MSRKQYKALSNQRGSAFLLVLFILFSILSGCANKTQATTMYLIRTEGQVAVSDDAENDVALQENLGLYSGYKVDTNEEGFAWIKLDDVKLTKMDQDSEIIFQKEGKHLDIEVKSGSLFFNVTEPLADDETMNIRTSTMSVGIQGTCGWVEAPEDNTMRVNLLAGRAQCEINGSQEPVPAGEMAVMTESKIEVQDFSAQAVPGFVLSEIGEDSALAETILKSSGLDVLNPKGPEELALEKYREIIGQADTYEYNSFSEPAGYQYALVQLQTSDAVPTLLLKQQTAEYLDYVRVFQYDTDSGTVLQPTDNLIEGMASTGGYRSGLAMQADGNGLRSVTMSSGTGSTSITRVTLAGDTLHYGVQWEGQINMIPNEPAPVDITWYNVSDASLLDNWPEAGNPIVPAAPSEPAADNGTLDSSAALPTDGNRIVFRGTVGQYSDEALINLQGISEEEAQWLRDGSTYWIIVLDTPQTMSLTSIGDPGSYYSNTVSLIDVTGAANIAQYAGQHLTFSIDAGQTWWPSDASLPLSQPRTNDIHVLQ